MTETTAFRSANVETYKSLAWQPNERPIAIA